MERWKHLINKRSIQYGLIIIVEKDGIICQICIFTFFSTIFQNLGKQRSCYLYLNIITISFNFTLFIIIFEKWINQSSLMVGLFLGKRIAYLFLQFCCEKLESILQYFFVYNNNLSLFQGIKQLVILVIFILESIEPESLVY